MAEEFANELQENPDCTRFVEDLVNYVMLRSSPRYVVEREPVLFHTFFYREIIEEKFKEFLHKAESHNEEFVSLMRQNISITPTGYATLIKKLEARIFEKGFSVTRFLIHCVHISTFAALFYNEGVDSAPELAKFHIVEVINRIPAGLPKTVGEIDNFMLPNV